MSNPNAAAITVTVVFASTTAQWCKTVIGTAPLTAAQAIQASGLLGCSPEFPTDLTDYVGCFSRPITLNTLLATGDRVEIYRPLTQDPKDARRQRAAARMKQ